MKNALRIAAYVTFTATLAGASACAVEEADEGGTTEAAATASAEPQPAGLKPAALQEVAHKKATCPFVGTMVAIGALPVYKSGQNLLAKIDEVGALANKTGRSLGGVVLRFFANGNHAEMKDANGRTVAVPKGYFSLDFAPSQGAHPGHSGILLQGTKAGGYRPGFDKAAWNRLLAKAVEKDGQRYIKRSALGAYIWENVERDPEATYVGRGFSLVLAKDVLDFIDDPSEQQVTKLSANNNIIGSAGEFALLLEVVATKEIDGEPAVPVSELEMMFVQKKMPAGWETRTLKAVGWAKHTGELVRGAECERFKERPITRALLHCK